MDKKSSQLISKKQRREVAQLKKAQRERLLKIGIPIVVVLSLLSLTNSPDPSAREPYGAVKLRELDETGIRYLQWLKAHGTSTEIFLFNAASQKFHDSALEAAPKAERNKVLRLYLSILLAAQRISFIAIAGMRLWIVFIVVGIVYGLRALKPYRAPDMLGATGNGRIFYSGILADLSELSDDGVPEKLVPGLACPKMSPANVVLSSPLGALLQKYNASNKTTSALAGIILAYPELPSFAPQSDDTQLVAHFAGATLLDGAVAALRQGLEVHKKISLGEEMPIAEPPQGEPVPGQNKKRTLEEHESLLGRGFYQVLSPSLKKEIAAMDSSMVAALILSYEAGKVLGYHQEGTRWVKKSQYIQLCARAVLHSIPEFSNEYGFNARRVLRQALIYGSRFSVFGPVRLPLQLSLETRALRQWTELLIAAPHELNAAIHETEFFGYAHELHSQWERAFFEGVIALNPAVVENAIATDTGLLFMPIERVVSIVRSGLSQAALKRLEELVTVVSQMQRIHAMSLALSADPAQGDAGRGPLPQFQKIFQPLSLQEQKTLAAKNSVDPQTIRDWSTIRNVFNSYGWLARQVGSSSVPEHSCCLSVFKGIDSLLGANMLGLLGKKGMIPFRSSHLELKFGKFWRTRFIPAHAASIADETELFDKLLLGYDPMEQEEENVGIS